MNSKQHSKPWQAMVNQKELVIVFDNLITRGAGKLFFIAPTPCVRQLRCHQQFASLRVTFLFTSFFEFWPTVASSLPLYMGGLS